MLRLFIFEPFENFDTIVESDVDEARLSRDLFVVKHNK